MIAVVIALLLYAAAGWYSYHPRGASWPQWLPLPALLLHAWLLSEQVFQGTTVTIGVNEALSLFAWQSAALLWALCWREPMRVLGSAVYPFAAVALLLVTLWPTPAAEAAMIVARHAEMMEQSEKRKKVA